MLGIDKTTLIEAIKNADAKIFTEKNLEDLICNLGRACVYDHGKVVWYNKEEDEDNNYDFDKDHIPKDPRH